MSTPRDDQTNQPDEQGTDGQVSEVSRLDQADDAIYPDDAVAGYPETESGSPDEGPAGPDAPSKRNRPIPDRKWDDD